MGEATIRRHLAALVDAGIIIRRDSPKVKRCRRPGPAGTIAQAYGVDLSPLVARAPETLGLAVPANPRDDPAMLPATMYDLADEVRWLPRGDWIGSPGRTA